MKLDAKWITLGFSIASAIPKIMTAVEVLKKGFSGQDKEDAAVDFAKQVEVVGESALDKDLLNEPAVEAAIRNAFRAMVAVQNTIASVKAARVRK